jgi:ABC-2 type transport system permease protein
MSNALPTTHSVSSHESSKWADGIRTRWMILRIALAERLAYRGDFVLGTLMRFLPIITQIFLWWAIFESVNASDPNQANISGYSFRDVVAYYLLTMVGRAFSSMPGLSSSIAMKVRDGEIKKFLVQPVDLITFLFWSRVAHKIAYYTIATIPFAIVFFLCRDFFPNGFPDATTFAAFVASLLLSFALGFYLETCIGMVGFWMLEVSSLLFVYMLFQFFLSGHMFPLDMLKVLPSPWYDLVTYLPIKYLAYFPAAVFLGKVTGVQLAFDLGMLVFWTLLFKLLSHWLYRRGLQRYSGFGG